MESGFHFNLSRPSPKFVTKLSIQFETIFTLYKLDFIINFQIKLSSCARSVLPCLEHIDLLCFFICRWKRFLVFLSLSKHSLNKPSGYQCSVDEFVCDNGQCIASSLRCDGDMACLDNSDEQNCACLSDEFNCGSGTCVDVTELCDGVKDCPEGSDETNCGKES